MLPASPARVFPALAHNPGNMDGENLSLRPSLRWITWMHLIFKNLKPKAFPTKLRRRGGGIFLSC
jgi:hypothetical protein